MKSVDSLSPDGSIKQAFLGDNYNGGGTARISVSVVAKNSSEERLIAYARSQRACVIKVGTDYIVFKSDCDATALIRKAEYR